MPRPPWPDGLRRAAWELSIRPAWPRRGSPALSGALRNTLKDGADADEIQRILDRLVGDSTHPVVLWLGSGKAMDTVKARLYYRGVSLAGSRIRTCGPIFSEREH